jgi:hypothetical protein
MGERIRHVKRLAQVGDEGTEILKRQPASVFTQESGFDKLCSGDGIVLSLLQTDHRVIPSSTNDNPDEPAFERLARQL